MSHKRICGIYFKGKEYHSTWLKVLYVAGQGEGDGGRVMMNNASPGRDMAVVCI